MKNRTTELIVSGKGVLSCIPEELCKLWPGKVICVVADFNTWKAAGEQVISVIKNAGLSTCEPFVFQERGYLHADTDRIAAVVSVLKKLGNVVPVAVGSGTINDIVKRAAEEAQLSYMCVPTAPSVDGYTSFGAAVTVNGFKTTLPCAAPRSVVADFTIMAAAPYTLIAAGYGDLAAKLVSGRDWLLAEILGLESIDASIWDLSQGKLRTRLSNPAGLRERDSVSVGAIFDGLCDTGLAMQDKGDSRPASGAEHHVSHCLEMRGMASGWQESLHGEKVAIGTLLSAAVWEELASLSGGEILNRSEALLPVSSRDRESEIRDIFAGTGIPSFAIDSAVKVSLEKLPDTDERIRRLHILGDDWDTIRNRLSTRRYDFDTLRGMFSAAGCPTPKDLDLSPDLLNWALHAAQTIRNRYTVLDLAWELGMLDFVVDHAVQRIFSE